MAEIVSATSSCIICVDRSVKPTYPDWMQKLMHPELGCTGPIEYDLFSDVELWLHENQKNGVATGNTIYEYLKSTNALGSCLNLQDGLAIQQQGITVFRELFKGEAAFLWASVGQSRTADLRVPYLCEFGDLVMVDWFWFDYYWKSRHPALRFRSK